MGSGIAAAIPIIIIPHNCRWKYEIDLKYFSPRLLDYYHYDTESHNYTIKHEVLLENYQTFLIEFYDCIGEPRVVMEPRKIDSYEMFKDVFDQETRNYGVPFICDQLGTFNIIGGRCPECWVFYLGSYKALLEECSTLAHFERILPKAMKNPLAHAVKFGLFG